MNLPKEQLNCLKIEEKSRLITLKEFYNPKYYPSKDISNEIIMRLINEGVGIQPSEVSHGSLSRGSLGNSQARGLAGAVTIDNDATMKDTVLFLKMYNIYLANHNSKFLINSISLKHITSNIDQLTTSNSLATQKLLADFFVKCGTVDHDNDHGWFISLFGHDSTALTTPLKTFIHSLESLINSGLEFNILLTAKWFDIVLVNLTKVVQVIIGGFHL
jgi:hypothetical protein